MKKGLLYFIVGIFYIMIFAWLFKTVPSFGFAIAFIGGSYAEEVTTDIVNLLS